MRGSICARGALAVTLVAGAVAISGAPSAQAALFGQCPPVDADAGCQFLVTVTNAGAPVVTQDTTQSPYEMSDDSLIGVQNSSSNSITALPLSAPGTSLFGFEADGICNPGTAPLPSGCVPAPGSPAGTTCGGQSLACSFPPPPGEPANYTEGGATSALPWPRGDRQNGYEGPTSWFSGISTDTSGGTVNFSPAIPPGGSTYFSLEAPPSAAAIKVGTPTTTPPPPPPNTTTPKVPPAFGPHGAIQGLPSTHVCLSKRHFIIHIRHYKGISYTVAIVFLNRKQVGVVKSHGGQFAAPINLRGLPAGTVRVKITVITTAGAIIAGTRTYHTCHKRLPFAGKPRL
ncbi:MAG: hypothetical protein QOI03_337 [Solirubrobacteraceae bacterium]|jgi:hypothetical protein|nr:hypothetical protein [Solirubrobacteraceae bacterium]